MYDELPQPEIRRPGIDAAEPPSGLCYFQCPAHHGVNVHTPDCPVDPDRSACDGCRAELDAEDTGYCPECGMPAEECHACDEGGDDWSGERCHSCGGSGWRIPDHCCRCGGSPYCDCCGRCGKPVATCACPVEVQMSDGTVRVLGPAREGGAQ